MKTLLKEKETIDLLKQMFLACEVGTNEFEYKRFRATHYKQREQINYLEKAHFIEHSGNIYRLNLIALAELEKGIPACKNILDVCEVIFQDLKQEYLQEPEQTIFPLNIAYKYNIPPEYIHRSTPYLLQANIFASHYVDENMGVCVVTREEILDYDNFRQCIEKKQKYSLQSLERFNEFHCSQDNNYFEATFDYDSADLRPLLHPEIIKYAYPHYENGHLRESVLNSVMALLEMIREKTELDEDGDSLIGKAFSHSKPYLKIGDLNTESGKNEQAGFMQMLKGANQGIRNIKAHSLKHDLNKLSAAQYLVFASLMARRIEEATVIKKNEPEKPQEKSAV